MKKNPSIQKKIEELENENESLKLELLRIRSLPLYDCLVSDLVQMAFWNTEQQNTPTSITSGSEEDYRAFDKSLQFMKAKPVLLKNIEDNQARMFPEDVKKAKQEATSLVDTVRKKLKNEIQIGA